MKVSDYILKKIYEAGVGHVFALSGGGCMHLIDSLGKISGLEYVCNLHEQACGMAADAYAQYTGRIGCALVTTGPGVTNSITAVAGAWIDSTPVIFLSGQVKTADLKPKNLRQLGPQEVDAISLVQAITKYAVTITDPTSIRYHLEKALYLAQTGRKGPVWLDIPLDIQAAQIQLDDQKGFIPPAPTGILTGIETQIKEVIGRLKSAERPVLLLGNGVRLAQAEEQAQHLIEKLQIPVLLSWKMTDFLSDDHPLYVGRPGAIGQRGANFTQQNCDFMMIIGSRMDLVQLAFSPQNFAREAFKVIVDIDEAETEKLKPHFQMSIVEDAKVFLNELLKQLHDVIQNGSAGPSWQSWPSWIDKTQSWKQKYPVVVEDYWKMTGVASHYCLVDVLSELLPQDVIVVPGSSGPCSEVVYQAFRAKKGQRVINNPGLGAMGFGLPQSIGVCIASGKKEVICINGDGGFQLNIQELETVKRLNLPIKFFILSNGAYASIMTTQKNFFQGAYVASNPQSGVTLPDIRKIATAYGIQNYRIASNHDLKSEVKKVLNFKGPVICEYVTSPEELTLFRVKSIMLENGKMASLPMEDLWPFLPRDKFFSEMMVEPHESSKHVKV